MIDLTPLDVRSKRGDFKRLMRGYDPQEVDGFLEIVAERLEQLIRENMALQERAGALQAQVTSQSDREQAVQAALVTAQELRADIRNQAQREADNIIKASETEGRRLVAEAEAAARTKLRGSERRLDLLADQITELERRRARFLKEFRQLLERELDVVDVETDRTPLEERTIDLELGTRRGGESPDATAEVQPVAAKVEPEEVPAVAPRSSPHEIPTIAPDAGPDEVPPADVPVEELAAAYERAADSEPELPAEPPVIDPPAPRPKVADRRPENLLLYLDPDDVEASG